DFVLSGANLDATKKAKVREIDKQLATLQATFDRKLLAATKAGALTVGSASQLAGLSDDGISAAARAAASRHLTGKWVITLQSPTQQPSLLSLNDRSTREQL